MSRRYILEWQILPPLRMCLLTSWVSSLENCPSKSLPILLLGCLYLFMPSDSHKYMYHVLLLPTIHRGRNWGSEGPNNLFQTHSWWEFLCLSEPVTYALHDAFPCLSVSVSGVWSLNPGNLTVRARSKREQRPLVPRYPWNRLHTEEIMKMQQEQRSPFSGCFWQSKLCPGTPPGKQTHFRPQGSLAPDELDTPQIHSLFFLDIQLGCTSQHPLLLGRSCDWVLPMAHGQKWWARFWPSSWSLPTSFHSLFPSSGWWIGDLVLEEVGAMRGKQLGSLNDHMGWKVTTDQECPVRLHVRRQNLVWSWATEIRGVVFASSISWLIHSPLSLCSSLKGEG